MFPSIVVLSDLTDVGDRALPVAGALALRADVPVELVTVSSPGMPDERDARDLEVRLAKLAGVRATPLVLHSNDPVSAVVDFLGDRPDALVVMSTHARGPVAELLLGSVSEAVLVQVQLPTLLVGPHVRVDPPPAMATLLACVDGGEGTESIVPAVVAWDRSFGGDGPWFVEVLPASTELSDQSLRADACEAGYVQRLAERVCQYGVDAQWDVAHGNDPGDTILEFARRFAGPVLALPSRRWTDPERPHFHSTAREIARRATVPVLVVHPARQNGARSTERTSARTTAPER